MEIKLTQMTPNPVRAIEEAASNCYDSKPGDGRIMRACFRSGHHAVLEFASFTFHITGVSRALLAQLTRHRHAGYAVRSQRYCSEDGANFVWPHTIKANPQTELVYMKFLEEAKSAYSTLQSLGIPNEDARYVLPNACETTLEFTCNLRELIHIMNERLCNRAQWEIKELCQKMREEVIAAEPAFANFLQPKCEHLGYCPEHASCGRKKRLKELIG